MLFNSNNHIQYYSFVCTKMNGFKLSKWLNSSIWSIDGALTGTTTPGQSRTGSNDYEEVLHIPQSCNPGVSLSVA